jgi:hypothetical protein
MRWLGNCCKVVQMRLLLLSLWLLWLLLLLVGVSLLVLVPIAGQRLVELLLLLLLVNDNDLGGLLWVLLQLHLG